MNFYQYPNASKYIGMSILAASLFASGYLYHDQFAIHEAKANVQENVVNLPSNINASKNVLKALPDFSSIAASQGPAVVNISVSGAVKTGLGPRGAPQLNPDDPFYEFFKRFQQPMPDQEAPVQGQGSGFIVKADGVILTNAHVVENADEVTVKLNDNREYKAKVIGVDKLSDVAVLKIDAKNLPTVKIGNPQSAKVGEWVVAIGSPFGFENTITAGIISAKSRALPDENFVPFLQTDVAVNPGNSGGPLFNLNGEVIGINSQIYSQSGGYQGLSFSIPIDVAMNVEHQLLDKGKVSRGQLGIAIQSINQELASSFGLFTPHGALVSAVKKGSPADKSGVAPGDVILKFNGKDINNASDLPPLVAELSPGTASKIEVWRNHKSKVLNVKLDELINPEDKPTHMMEPSNNKIGLTVRPLSELEAIKAEVDQGLVVENVNRGPAEKAGIKPGDILLAVNGEKIKSVEQFKTYLDKNQKYLAILVLRGDSKLFIPVEIG
ncbi:MAG: DegQ family serine endoprotease [Methylophilus sp.]